MKPLTNWRVLQVAVAVQVLKEVLPTQEHSMIPDHGKWVPEFYRDTDDY